MTEKAQQASDAPTLPQAVLVELLLGGLGLIVIVASGRGSSAFSAPIAPVVAVAVGVLVGAALGGLVGLFLVRPPLAARVQPFLRRFTTARPTAINFVILGLAAAIGEETLFRAAIQPLLGVGVAAVLFTLAHAPIADLRHLTRGKLSYVALAFAMGLLLGFLYDVAGLAASMGAHAAFDATLLIVIAPLIRVQLVAAPKPT